MFHIESLNQDGNKLAHVGERPAFYALIMNNITLIGYFITVEAVRWAAEDIMANEGGDV
jgi:hypothetical protein